MFYSFLTGALQVTPSLHPLTIVKPPVFVVVRLIRDGECRSSCVLFLAHMPLANGPGLVCSILLGKLIRGTMDYYIVTLDSSASDTPSHAPQECTVNSGICHYPAVSRGSLIEYMMAF